jgi:hypothetical protein
MYVPPLRTLIHVATALIAAGGLTGPESCLAWGDTSRMEQIVESKVASKQFMGSVLVARGDEVLLDRGYGFANLERPFVKRETSGSAHGPPL